MSDFVQGACVFAAGAAFGVGIYILTPVIQTNLRQIRQEEAA